MQLPSIGVDLNESFSGLYSNQGGLQGGPMMGQQPQMGQPQMAPQIPMTPPAGIMGDPMMMEDSMMMDEEPQSEIDMIEEKLQAMAMASDGAITVKRKSKKKGSK